LDPRRVARLVLSSFASVVCAAAFGAACAAEDEPAEAPAVEPGVERDAGAPSDAGRAPDTSDIERVTVGHDRQLRGAWISTVYNGTWPSNTGLTEATAKAELVAQLDALASANMNAVFFQVRPESDAVYASVLEPWSRFLTGTQGTDPGWDPLTFAIAEAHERGIELHAWINPYRGLTSSAIAVADTHVTKALSAHAVVYGNQLWMDPGAPLVRAHILDVIRDLLERYDLDGLHFDDYFYPYPIANTTFDDDASYAAYTGGGGMLAKGDWRRSNVDTLVKEAAGLVAKTRPDARFGISPFGIYRPGTPPGITGLDAYAALYCDPVKWMKEGWVDYLAPQLYWPTTRAGQAFDKLVAWWGTLPGPGQSIFVGHDATKVGDADWPLSEYDTQMKLIAAQRPNGVLGSIFFSAKPLVSDELGLRTALAKDHWSRPATTPLLAVAPPLAANELDPVIARSEDGKVVVTPPAGKHVRAIAVYATDGSLARLVPAADAPATRPLDLEEGRWAISVIDRFGREGPAVVIDAP
jgi:uncharacterized lipoprotein YddW (UPF0748 family)